MRNNSTYIGKVVILLLLYQGVPCALYWVYPPSLRPPFVRGALVLLFDIIPIVFLIAVFRKQLKKEWLRFVHDESRKRNLNLLRLIPYYLLLAATSIICNKIIYTLVQSGSMNEGAVNALHVHNSMWIRITSIIADVLFAPLIEEMIFRFGIFHAIRKNSRIFAYIISGLAFGLMHVIGPIMDGYYSQLLYIISYGILGFFFARYYEKCDNIFYPIILHSISNIVASIL